LPIDVRRIARAAIDIIRLTFARDRLGDAAGHGPEPAARAPRRFLRVLLALEPLPLDPPAPARPRRASLLRAALAPEPLPEDPVPPAAPAHPRLGLRALLAPEPLPLDPVPPARRRPSRLAALFAPERLDDP
jgi:hypothetical protein